jgi:hypothetical protein
MRKSGQEAVRVTQDVSACYGELGVPADQVGAGHSRARERERR